MNHAEEFLKEKQLFQLGVLPTETPHPKTFDLSRLAKSELDQALKLMRQVDLEALRVIQREFASYQPLFTAVAETLEEKGRVYLVGCGATGRLSLSLEFLWRRRHPDSDQVRSLMAGGDVALVHSLEGFEDFPQYGARHLKQIGFTSEDLLIATTEGGETPYVIGATEFAAGESRRSPFFLFCNPAPILSAHVERSRRVLANAKIKAICLETGPMALTGSTRMQASTVLMLVVGLALEYGRDFARAKKELETWLKFVEGSPVAPLKAFVLKESQTYHEGEYTCYTADDLAMTVFTDTTERAPTFNLAPFDNPAQRTSRHSLTYIALPATKNAEEAWHALLARPPRPLEWPEIHAKTSAEYMLSFDFSRQALAFRKDLLPSRPHYPFSITATEKALNFHFRELEAAFPLSGQNALFDHLSLKMLMNIHSTLVFGRLGRFEGNLMTWVYPSNGKLVDRAARYTQILLLQRGFKEFSYDNIVRTQFALKASLSPKESIVHKTIEKLTGKPYVER